MHNFILFLYKAEKERVKRDNCKIVDKHNNRNTKLFEAQNMKQSYSVKPPYNKKDKAYRTPFTLKSSNFS